MCGESPSPLHRKVFSRAVRHVHRCLYGQYCCLLVVQDTSLCRAGMLMAEGVSSLFVLELNVEANAQYAVLAPIVVSFRAGRSQCVYVTRLVETVHVTQVNIETLGALHTHA